MLEAGEWRVRNTKLVIKSGKKAKGGDGNVEEEYFIFAFSVRNQMCVFIKYTLQTDPLGWISPHCCPGSLGEEDSQHLKGTRDARKLSAAVL